MYETSLLFHNLPFKKQKQNVKILQVTQIFNQNDQQTQGKTKYSNYKDRSGFIDKEHANDRLMVWLGLDLLAVVELFDVGVFGYEQKEC